ncbi:MAG: DUF4386 domain-containing protein [Candidatus Thorarchaeota archaeon]
MSIKIWLSGFFFFFIIITNFASGIFGYKTFNDDEINDKLQIINRNPIKFKIGFMLILLEHFGIISLALMLFIAFNPYNIILGIVWCICRIGEALIQIYDKKNYWGLLNIANKYSDTSEVEKSKLIDLGNSILETKMSRFTFAQTFFSIGTLAYSILFITYGVVPIIIGWFGFVASIIYGLGNGIFRIKADFKILWNIGGLLILLFEVVLGGWLLFFSQL